MMLAIPVSVFEASGIQTPLAVSRPLPRNYTSCGLRILSIWNPPRSARAFYIGFGQLRAAIGHWMRAGGHARTVEIRNPTALHRSFFAAATNRVAPEWRPEVDLPARRALHLPKRRPPVQIFPQGIQRADFAKRHDFPFL